jgi:hypothetical protein
MKNIFALTISLIVILGITNANATTINVPADVPTIQQGIDIAKDGDIVLVAPGTYFERIDYLEKSITVTSEAGPEVTIIDGSNTGPVVTIHWVVADSEFSGFTVRNGIATWGAGMSIGASSPTIIGNIFDSNEGSAGIAINVNVSSPTIERNIFRNNTCEGPNILSGVVTIINMSSPQILNNVFDGNLCRGITLLTPGGTQPIVLNNTIIGNTAGIRLDRRTDRALNIFSNNIIVENGIGLEVEYGDETFNPTWENNLVFNNSINYDFISDQTGTNGNISVDPEFVDSPSGNYNLSLFSPAIDAGSNTVAELPIADFNGNDRIFDGDCDGVGVVDIGAFEFGEPPATIQLVEDLIEYVVIQGFNNGIEKSLLKELNTALNLLAEPSNIESAISALNEFNNIVNKKRHISLEQEVELTGIANYIIDNLQYCS